MACPKTVPGDWRDILGAFLGNNRAKRRAGNLWPDGFLQNRFHSSNPEHVDLIEVSERM